MTRMPPGAYLSVIGSVRPDSGGQTRVLLMRVRLFAQELGLDVPVLTYDPAPDYDAVRAALISEGLLLPRSQLLNLHEDLRARDLTAHPVLDVPAPVAEGVVVAEQPDAAGLPWQRRVSPGQGGDDWFDYLRPDGTTYARTPADSKKGTTTVLTPSGGVVGTWPTLGGLWQWWTQEVAPPTGDVFVLSDSRHVARELSHIADPRFLFLYQLHNPHTVGERRWNSPVNTSYRATMNASGRLDALITLTDRQRDDIVRRYGATDNLAVIPNTFDPPPPPSPAPDRVPGRIVMIARLHRQKRLDRAVEAFAFLAAGHPSAHLDIYGEGPERDALQQQIDGAGLTDRVLLHGHDPRAPEHLWAADLSWLTSGFEGFALALVEARSRGCPVVTFDVPYGPREQVTDGVDGRLVPAGDTRGLASATAALLDDRAGLERMREPARRGVDRFSPRRFLDNWAQVTDDALARRPARTRLHRVEVQSLDLRLPTAASGSLGLDAAVRVHGRGDLSAATWHWQAYTASSDDPVDLPLTVTGTGTGHHLSGETPLAPLAARLGGTDGVTVRLLLVWGNSSWQRDLHEGALTPDRRGSVRRVASALRRRLRVED